MKLLPLIVFALLIIQLIPLSSAQTNLNIEMYTDRQNYLNTQTINVSYDVYGNNGRTISGGKGTWYLNYTANGTLLSGGNITSSHGQLRIELSQYNLSAVGAGMEFTLSFIYHYDNTSAKKSSYIWIINPNFVRVTIQVYPTGNGFFPGDFTTIEIYSSVTQIPVAYVSIKHNGSLWKNITGLWIKNSGYVNYNFQIPVIWKSGDSVEIVAKIGNSTGDSSFTIQNNYHLQIIINKKINDIISGDRINITVNYTNVKNPYFHFYINSTYATLYHYFTANNHISFLIPENYSGVINIVCIVYNATTIIGEVNKLINVRYAFLDVQFNREYFKAGENIGVYVDFRSNVIKSPAFVYQIYEKNGYNYYLSQEITTSSRFITIHVPSNPPNQYTVVVFAKSVLYSATASAMIYYQEPVFLTANIVTRSSYAIAVYTPGEKLLINYQVSGNAGKGFLYYGFGNGFYTNPKIIRINGSKIGYLSIIIPQTVRNGIYEIHMKIASTVGSREISIPVSVNDNPPWSQYLIFTIPAADFLTLIMVAAMVVAGVFYIKYDKTKKDVKSQNDKKNNKANDDILNDEKS